LKKKLTPKQLHFARCVASGMSQSDGYREAFNVKTLTKPESVHQSASRLIADPNVASRVQHLIGLRERAVAASAVSDRERVLSKLRGWMDEAEPSDSVKVRAAELLGKSANLFATDINVVDQRKSSEGLAAEIEAMLLAANESAKPSTDTSTEVH
tara:strand:- start:537 stop:1001 length:465 start_codon:yes stop_codon:yes gene_type:complete